MSETHQQSGENDGTIRESLENWSSTLFLVGGVMFVVAAAASVVTIVTGVERVHMYLGEAFIAAGWIAPLIGLLGLYPTLVDRSRWLARSGAVFAAIGTVAFAVLGVASLVVFFSGGSLEELLPVFILPGVIIGSFLAFVSFSTASLRSAVHSRTVGILLLVPSLIFVTNFFILPAILGAPPYPTEVGLIVVSALALAMFAIGYSLRTEVIPTDTTKPSGESTTH